jgi:hypothetical protein
VDPWFRNSAEMRRAMCNVGWPEAVTVAMLVSVTLIWAACGGSYCKEIWLLRLK